MLDRVAVKLDGGAPGFDEKLEVLLSGRCGSVFPLSVIEDDTGMTGYYCVAGYTRLSRLEGTDAAETLTLLEKTVEALEECRQYLLFPEEMKLSTDTVYAGPGFERVKLVYVPDRGRTAAEKLCGFAEELKDIAGENGRTYLDTARQMLAVENLSGRGIRAFLTGLRREARLRGIT